MDEQSKERKEHTTSSGWPWLESVSAPSWWMMAFEARAAMEWALMPFTLPWLKDAPEGDGHPVLVLPGLVANDLSTWPLRKFLESRRYAVYPWEQGFNVGPKDDVVNKLIAHIHDIQRKHKRSVSLVGWSLGGVMARVLAARFPDLIRSVITLGSPHGGDPRATRAWRVFEWVSGLSVDDPALRELLSAHPQSPITSVMSKSDGVVAWPLSVLPETPLSENLEVPASHLGMGVHPAVWWLIADRLSQHEGEWQPLDRNGWLRLFVDKPIKRRQRGTQTRTRAALPV